MPEATPPPPPPAASAPEAPATPPAGTIEGFKSEESKSAVLADLAKERDARQALEQQINAIQAGQVAQSKALAEAFGLTEAPKSEDLAETVKALQAQFQGAQLEATRLRIAAEHKIPAEFHDLLTETDMEKLTAQAVKVGALVAAHTAATAPPPFQANPGQGQGGSTDAVAALDQQITEAAKDNNIHLSIQLKQQRAALLAKKS